MSAWSLRHSPGSDWQEAISTWIGENDELCNCRIRQNRPGPRPAFARKNIDVIVASRRPPEELAPQARAIGPTVVAKSLQQALEAGHNLPGGPVRGASRDCEGAAELEKQDGHRCDERVPSSTRGARKSTFLRLRCQGIPRREGREGFQSPGLQPPWRPIRSSKGAIELSFCRAMTKTRSLPWQI